MGPELRAATGALATLALVALALLAAGCGGVSQGAEGDRARLTLVAYSTPREAYEALVPAFQRTEGGLGVGVERSYGSSGDQRRAVASGLGADVVALSLEPDVTRLVEAGLVAGDWNAGPHRGMVTNSVVVLAVRKGNPKGIRGWEDLVRRDVDVITPNPATSGGARWNIMAAYGAASDRGRDHAAGVRYLGRLLANVSVQDKSARESLQTFAGGKGDVLIAYENEAITARAKGADLDYVVPADTILIENPIAVVQRGRSLRHAQAFVEFLRSEPAQRIFAEQGYRPVLDTPAGARDLPRPARLFRIDDLGGWARVSETFFDADQGLINEIQRELGNEVDG